MKVLILILLITACVECNYFTNVPYGEYVSITSSWWSPRITLYGDASVFYRTDGILINLYLFDSDGYYNFTHGMAYTAIKENIGCSPSFYVPCELNGRTHLGTRYYGVLENKGDMNSFLLYQDGGYITIVTITITAIILRIVL